ncbi:Long-chain-alcohol oxidase [Psidium guajava]|nr:Long-chain-alcohol oxidase [Psidium guajava]
MKLCLLFLGLVGTAAVCRATVEGPNLGSALSPSVGVELRRVRPARSIAIGVLDPCQRPRPPPDCRLPKPVHNYTRPCAKFNRCRGNPPRQEAIDV